MDCPVCGRKLDPATLLCQCGAENPGSESPGEGSLDGRLSQLAAHLEGLSGQVKALNRQVLEAREQLTALAGLARTPGVGKEPGPRTEQEMREEPLPGVPGKPPSTASPGGVSGTPQPAGPPGASLPDSPVSSDRVSGTRSGPLQAGRKVTPEWEALIGGNWLLKVGIAAIILGALYFLKYAFDNRWIGDTGRVLIGVLAGLTLLYLGERFRQKGYRLYGQTLSGGGVAVLYLSLYAAFNFYSLVPQSVAFSLMVLVTAVCATLSARYASATLAILGILGGLLTPFWLSTGESHQVGLLTYLFILDCGFGWLARRQRWFFLNWMSSVGTLVLFFGWAVTFYTRDALWVTQLYLTLFAGLFVFLGWKAPGDPFRMLQGKAMAVASVVLFFFSSQGLLGHSVWSYWVFLVLFSGLFLALSMRRRVNSIARGAIGLLALGIPIWASSYYAVEYRQAVWWMATLLFLLYFTQLVVRHRLVVSPGDAADVHVCLTNGLGYFGLSYYVLSDEYGGWMGSLALGIALIHLLGARLTLLSRNRPKGLLLAFVGAALILVTLAVPIQLEQNWITMAWAVEAVVLAWIGFEARTVHLRVAALVVLVLALLTLLAGDVGRDAGGGSLILNRRFGSFLAVIASAYLLAAVYRNRRGLWQDWEEHLPLGLILLANVLSVFCVSLEAWFHYQRRVGELVEALAREEILQESHGALLTAVLSSRQLTLSLLWGVYSIISVVCGIVWHYRPIRLFGISLFILTILKVFLMDIWTLRQFYRIVSVIGLGVLLLGVAFLYQRFKGLIVDR